MQFLWPHGGALPDGFVGVLTTPGHKGIPASIRDGAQWAADNQAFTIGFQPDVFFSWLKTMQPYRDQCLFVAVPDAVGDYAETRRLWRQWLPAFAGWPLAYVGQDGETDIPTEASALFVGGSTFWKLCEQADDLIRLAQARGLHIHIGRVNWGRRYRHFRLLPGSESFTCDGTRGRMDGLHRTAIAWRAYQEQPPLW